jgi:oxygen-dependent protoporphyrinogen oxidase
MRAIVIGAGISGLAAAVRLAERGVDVGVFDAAERAGGVISSVERNGFLFELGPQSFQTTPALLDLIRSAGVGEECVMAPSRAPRYVYAGGRLNAVPMGPQIMVSGSLLGWGTRMRLMRDLAGHSAPPERAESLAEFVRRKFGGEMLDRLAGPFVSGIYAGDPERLGLGDAFPDILRWEKEHGSVLRGAMRSMKARRERGEARPGLAAMRRGNASLFDALAAKLGARLRLGIAVESIRVTGSANAPGFEVRMRGAAGEEAHTAECVVMATPTGAAAKMLGSLAPRAAELLGRVEYAPVAVVGAGYRREQVKNPLDGFGFLMARSERRKTLGTVWMSSLFPGRAPSGHVNMASFIGGATNPATTELPPDEIAGIVERELAPILGISGAPVERMVWVHRRALPQYNVGHRRLVEEILLEVARVPGLFLVGNYVDGPSTGACVDLAFRTAERVVKAFEAGGDAGRRIATG